MGAGKVILGTLAGMAVGATAGALFAPTKGTVTRKKITAKGKAFSKSAKGKIKSTAKTVARAYGSAKEQAEDLIEREKEVIAGVKIPSEKRS